MNKEELYSGAEIIVHRLLKEEVQFVFAYIGGAVIPLFDALGRVSDRLQMIRPNHEQGGVHAADGYARVSGKPGVVITTSGPGALNTLTGLGTAFMDSVPLVVITGQVPLSKIGSDAFQESDIVGMSAAVTKGSWLVREIDRLDETLEKAFRLASSGRPGPVLVDVPVDIQMQSTRVAPFPGGIGQKRAPSDHAPFIERLMELLRQSKAPLILSGGGVISGGAAFAVARFAERYGIPVVTTLLGKGLPLKSKALDLGGIGMHGSIYGNKALHHTDLLLVLGSRLSDRILGDVRSFAAEGKIVQVDIDDAEIGKVKGVDLGLVADLTDLFEQISSLAEPLPDYQPWRARVARWRLDHPMNFEMGGKNLKPQTLMHELNRFRSPEGILVTDVGQNQMWAAQYIPVNRPRSHLTSGGLGTMGYALPAAIGAQLARPDAEVLALCGDGGFAMNMQELETLKRLRLPVKLLIVDNRALGMVRQWQNLLCDGRNVETLSQSDIDYVSLGRAFGIWSRSLGETHELSGALSELFAQRGPALLHVRVDPAEYVMPMVPVGASIDKPLILIEKR